MKELIDVEGDGNCFYRAIYGYVLHNHMNNNFNTDITEFLQLFECSKAAKQFKDSQSYIGDHFADDDFRKRLYNIGQENEWESCIRDYLAKFIIRKKNGMVKEIYDNLQALDMPTYKETIKYYTKWFTDLFGEHKPGDLDVFADVFANNIKLTKTEACLLDIHIFEHILKFFGYNLNITVISQVTKTIVADKLSSLPAKPNKKTIYLIYIPGHYNFVLFSEGSASRSMQGGSRKIMHQNKIYKKYYDKKTKKSYIKKNRKLLYI